MIKINNLSDFTRDSKETGVIIELENGDRVFVDKKGVTRNLTKQTAELWKETFGLEKLEDEIIAKIPQEIQESIGKPIKLKVGSLLKLIANNREQYIQEITPTFAEPDIVFKEKEMLLFAKVIGEKQYFVNVNLEKDEYFVTISCSPKREQTIENKLKEIDEKDLLYRSPNFESYSPQKAFTGITSSTNKNGNEMIIPQQSKQKNRLVINIYGSAGVGKTTLAKKLQDFMTQYSKENQKYNKFEPQLKPALATEFATELINQGKFEVLNNQPFVTKGQIQKLNEAFEKSNLVITDSPLELGRIYNCDYTKANEVSNLINQAEKNYTSIDLFLQHDSDTAKTYSMQGRVHTLEQSIEKEKELLSNLKNKEVIFINRNEDLEMIFARIQNTSQWRNFEVEAFSVSTAQDRKSIRDEVNKVGSQLFNTGNKNKDFFNKTISEIANSDKNDKGLF